MIDHIFLNGTEWIYYFFFNVSFFPARIWTGTLKYIALQILLSFFYVFTQLKTFSLCVEIENLQNISYFLIINNFVMYALLLDILINSNN